MLDTVGVALRVAVPGTLVRVIDSMVPPVSDPLRNFRVHGVMFQALPTNTGLVYVGQSGLVRATYAEVLAFLAIPTVNFIPTFSAALTLAPNAISLEDLYLDADVATNGVICTFLVT